MSVTTFNVRMDSEIKQRLDDFCDKAGFTTATAINMFAYAVLRENRLPFDVAVNPNDWFCSESNIKYLKKLKADVESGQLTLSPHELIEVEDD